MADAPPSDAGLASGILNTTGQVGGALGLAVLATLASWRTLGLVREGAAGTQALAAGYHLAFLFGAATVAVTLALAMSMLRPKSLIPVDLPEAEPEAVA